MVCFIMLRQAATFGRRHLSSVLVQRANRDCFVSSARYLSTPGARAEESSANANGTISSSRVEDGSGRSVSDAFAANKVQDAETVSESESSSQDAAIAAALGEKDAEIADLKDRSLRLLAEMENVRAIARRDVSAARDFGISGFARSLLAVADNLSLALQAVPKEKLDNDQVLASLHQGVQATENELQKVFTQHGVKPFGDVGEVFDPNRHQALFEAPAESGTPGTVLNVTKVGYSIGERILRPAEVGVVKSR